MRLRSIARSALAVLFAAAAVVPGVALAADEAEPKPADAPSEAPAPGSAKPSPEDPDEGSPIFQAAREAAEREEAAEATVFTNEDLERMMANLPPEKRAQGVYQATAAATPAPAEGATPAGATPAAGAAPESALDWLESQQKAKGDREQALGEARERVSELEQRIATLERRALAIRNPFLPRPEAPEPPEGEESDWDELDGRERADRTERELAEARRDLDEARRTLAALESGRP